MGMLDRLLNQDSFTEAFDELQKNHRKLSEEFETQKAVNKQLAEDYIALEEKYTKLKADPEQYIEEQLEKRMLQIHDNPRRHKAYQIGRQDAYREMGIWRLDAMEAGHRLVMDACGDVYELLELQDVKPDDDKVTTLADDEIIIDDLVEVAQNDSDSTRR